MTRLDGAHRGERAVIILGGPSLVASGFDFGRLRDRQFVTFVETKALTPQLLQHGFEPDYILLPFPEKAKDNTLQHFVYRSFLAGTRIEPMLRSKFRPVARDLRARFDQLYQSWRPERGPHKRFKWRPDVYLPDSPYDLLGRVAGAKIIANRTLLREYFPNFPFADRTCYFEQESSTGTFEREAYFNPVSRDGVLWIRGVGQFYNQAAIVLYPLLRSMGFREAYFLGMDMSMLGSMEYAAPFTFKSMAHFWWFFHRSRRVFNANYKANGLLFRRPQSEFNDLRLIWSEAPVTFTRVYEPWRYATAVEGIRTIDFDAFERL
jgi:hypothetical protein